MSVYMKNSPKKQPLKLTNSAKSRDRRQYVDINCFCVEAANNWKIKFLKIYNRIKHEICSNKLTEDL